MLDILIFALVVIVICGAVLENIRLKNKNIELLFLLAQLNIDNGLLKKNIASSDDVEKDHLIKFLSETRDISYEFISDFQKQLVDLKTELDPYVSFFEDFNLSQEEKDINSEIIIKFINHYKKLLDFLPEEESNGR
jgi:hypothetical protein